MLEVIYGMGLVFYFYFPRCIDTTYFITAAHKMSRFAIKPYYIMPLFLCEKQHENRQNVIMIIYRQFMVL